MIIGIVAVAKDLVIGKGGKLPWHYPADLKFFKETTTGHVVVMGYRTWQSIGRPLPNRLNVVLSRSSRSDVPPNVMTLTGIDEVLDLSRYVNRNVFIIGGAEVFKEFKDLIEKWFVTRIPDEIPDAETFMPAHLLDGFRSSDTKDIGDGLTVETWTRELQT